MKHVLIENVESDQAWGVSAGVPAGVTVALKNGWLSLEDGGDWQSKWSDAMEASSNEK